MLRNIFQRNMNIFLQAFMKIKSCSSKKSNNLRNSSSSYVPYHNMNSLSVIYDSFVILNNTTKDVMNHLEIKIRMSISLM